MKFSFNKMLCSIHLLIYSSVLFIEINSYGIFSSRFKRDLSNYQPKCSPQTTAVDQVIDSSYQNETSRKKRFVLFPDLYYF
jgi:hypothetical protein